jgi:DNA end-binding protein Ku
MATRAIWKGLIHCCGTRIPVRLYSAVKDLDIRFHLLHDQDKSRLKMRLRNPRTNDVVEYSEAQRGLQVDRALFVTFDDRELEALEPTPSRDIDITRFVSPDAIGHHLYERPYYLAPESDSADDYFAFAAALEKEGKVGVAKWVMRKKQYVAALQSFGDYLMLITLRSVAEVIPTEKLGAPGGTKPTEKEVQLAEQLVAALEEDFQPQGFHDEYRQRVVELIESKQRGRRIKLKKFKEKPQAKSLAKLLEASLRRG